jgi:hypothetical protein
MDGPTRLPRPIAGIAGCLLTGLLVCLPCLSGCRESAAVLPGDIRQYTVARQRTVPDMATAAAASRPRESAGGLRLQYDVPTGWTDRGGSGLRLATLALGDPDEGHEVTVIPAAGTLEGNVARWQGQLDPEQEEAATAAAVRAALDAAEPVDVGGVTATVVTLLDEAARVRHGKDRPEEIGAAGDAPPGNGQAILAAMIPLDETASLFVKYKGDAAVARRERERFIEFVHSIRWK